MRKRQVNTIHLLNFDNFDFIKSESLELPTQIAVNISLKLICSDVHLHLLMILVLIYKSIIDIMRVGIPITAIGHW